MIRPFLFLMAASALMGAPPAIDDPRSVTVGERSVVPINVCQLQATILVLPEHELTRNTVVSDTENWVLQTTASNQASRFLSVKVKNVIPGLKQPQFARFCS